MPQSKRKIETIDLTEDDDDLPPSQPAKYARPNIPSSSSRTTPHQSRTQHVYPTPPFSSQPSSSQRSSHDLTSTTHSEAERERWLAPASTQEVDADVRREIDLTQDFDDDVYANYQLYGIFPSKIVGLRFYNGTATVGEYVKVRREPGNPYDRNAIRIDNVMNVQIGHIGRAHAAKLAPFMDSGSLLVEGALTGAPSYYDCPIGLKMFGTSDPVAAAALKQQMQAVKLPVNELNKAEAESKRRAQELAKQQKAREKAAAAMQKSGHTVFDLEGPNRYSNLGSGAPGSSQESLPNMEQLLSGTAMYNPREVQDVVNKFAAGEDVLAAMPMANQPGKLSTILLPYQRQGLQWMLDHENPRPPTGDDTVQLWKKSHGLYTNIATSFSVKKPPVLASGGMLADDMGLGKTIQIISLIIADPQRSRQPTLIVAPLSVMSNWSGQAASHVKKEFTPRILTYHGQEKRGLTPEQFTEYDIVITTYQTMTLELYPYGKSEPEKLPAARGLYSVAWRRVVLDEGHQIRNPKAKMAQAACALQAQSRWVLTGTPIVNSLKDLYSHVKFLRLTGGMAEFDIFNGTLIRPLKNGDPNARVLLQALMATLCLRRMKDMKFIDLRLPEITFHKYPIKFLPHEQERYDAFKAEAKGLVEAAKAKEGENTMTHLLEVLLRLRQTCNHWKMCGEDRVKKLLSLVEENKVIDVVDPANRKALQDLLQTKIDSQEECPICMDTMKSPVITACAHAFCREDIEKVIETQHKCPMCRSELKDTGMIVEPAANFGEDDTTMDIDAETTSSKIEALVKVLKASSKDSDTKTVVFSQWTTFLDLVQSQLLRHGLHFTRLDGRMNAARRDAAIESLNTEGKCKIMLASLSVCSVGLNLVAANQVILADSWWAPAIEDQAVDRVHRLGQRRACKVVRLVMEDTIEDGVLEIQAKKRKLAATAFGEREGQRSRKERTGGTLRDIERLIG